MLRLLDCIAETSGPVGAAEMARELDTSRAAVHRQLVTLASAGWLKADSNGRYQLTMRAAHLGHAALNHIGLLGEASDLLGDFASSVGEVASLAVLDGHDARVIQRAAPGRSLHVTVELGDRFPILDSASGQVLAAYLEPTALIELANSGVRLPTSEDLELVRRNGYAQFRLNDRDDLLAIAVPLGAGRTTIELALSIIGPFTRIDMASAVTGLLETAAKIDRLMTTTTSLSGSYELTNR